MKTIKVGRNTFPETIDLLLEKEKEIYATLVHTRRPSFKIHNTPGQAHSAVNCHRDSSIVGLYKLVGTSFEVEAIYPDYSCPDCGTRGYYVEDNDAPIWNVDKYCNVCALKRGFKLR